MNVVVPVVAVALAALFDLTPAVNIALLARCASSRSAAAHPTRPVMGSAMKTISPVSSVKGPRRKSP